MSWEGYAGIELTEKEITALAHIMEMEKEKVMRLARISDDGVFKLLVSKLELVKDVEKLGRDIKEIEKAGGDRYGVLTLHEAKKLFVKISLVGVDVMSDEISSIKAELLRTEKTD